MTDCIYCDDCRDENCSECGLYVDKYGNTEAVFKYCCFPDCGCDGARNCHAPSGSNDNANIGNIENMWNRADKQATEAKNILINAVMIGVV